MSTTVVPQTFRDRIADQNKVPLCEEFIATIESLALLNEKSEDEIYGLWRKYCADCHNFDQSPIVSEFIEWNKLHDVIRLTESEVA